MPCDSAVIMSATASADLYKYLMNMEVTEYSCKQARYSGKILQYTNSSYSRNALANKDSSELLKFVHSIVGDDEVITFKCSEEEFGTAYHYGNIEGLNCLEGKNISVIGLPNSHENVYKLYGIVTTRTSTLTITMIVLVGKYCYWFRVAIWNGDSRCSAAMTSPPAPS